MSTWLRRLLHALAWLALAVGLCIAAGWAVLHLWIVPRIDDFRPALERLASRTMGMPVQVGELRAESTGWAPSFELRQIRLLDHEGRTALSLPRVVVAISVRSVLNLNLEQLVLDRPELDIRHTANGQWLIAGLALGTANSEHSAAADWLFGQREVVVRAGTVRWTSERAQAGAGLDPQQATPLALTDVDLVLRNTLRLHELRLDATPPADWGERFVLMARMRRGLLSTHPGDLREWSGQAFAWFPQVDVSQLRQHTRLGVDLLSGQGRLRLWSDIRQGEWVGGTADLDLRQVRLRLDDQLQALGFDQLSGRVSGQHDASGWSVATEQLAFVSEQGLVWPGGNLRVQQRRGIHGKPTQGQLQGEHLDLQALRELALRLPLPQRWHEALAQHQLAGLLRALQIQWQGDAPQSLADVQGELQAEQVHIQAQTSTTAPSPASSGLGMHGFQLKAKWDARGGQAQASLPQGGWLTWPGLLEDSTVPIGQLQADAQWQMQNGQAQKLQWKLRADNPDLQGQSQGQWLADPHGGSGQLDLQAQVSRARAERVHRYLPLALPAEVRHYVRDSVRAGTIQDLKIRIHGDVDKLPAATAREGEFRLAGKLRDVELAYVPTALLPPGSVPWPVLQGLQGELVFERHGMRLSAASARFGDGKQAVQVQPLRASIADLGHDARLDVQAELKGPAAQVLRTLQQSPVDRMLSGALAPLHASGSLQGRLQLAIPLLHVDDTRVQGSVGLNGNDVQLGPQLPLFEKTQGQLQFSERSFTLQGVQTRLLGGNTRLEGGLRSAPPAGEAALLVRAQGQVSAEGLRTARQLAPLDTLARQLRGQTSYSASLGWRAGQPELQLRSNLEGLDILLPAPLGKRAAQALPLNISTRVLDGAGTRDQLQVQLGQIASAHYVRELSGAQARALRGSVLVGAGLGGGSNAAASLPEQGVSAVARFTDLSLDDWQAAWPAGAVTEGGDDSDTVWQSYLPDRLGLQAQSLTAQGRTLHEVVAGITREGMTWRANLDARELSGQAVYSLPTRQQAGRLYARLARLNLPPSAVNEVESLLDAPPTSMPALDIEIEDLTLRGKRLGRVEIEAINAESRSPRLNAASGTPEGREWQLQKFNIGLPEATLRANGRWAAAEGQRPRRSEMNFRLDVQDAGALLTRLGTPGALRAGAGRLEGQIGWNGSPLSPHYPSMQGQFQVRMGRGQFLQADPGAAKLLGVLSLQGLPRRLLLDFRDVFYEGFAFDSVQGDVQIQQGIASTHNLQIEGVNAVVKMEGSADIAHETQQLKVLILPQLNAGGASVLAGLAINPVVGLTSYLAQWLLTSPLARANVQEFSIDGSWSEPRVNRIEPHSGNGTAPARQP